MNSTSMISSLIDTRLWSSVRLSSKSQLVRLISTQNLSSNEKIINKQISIHNNDQSNQSPLVLIFGWGYGKKKHLLKYSEIFERKEFTSVIIQTSLINSLFRTSSAGKREAENVNKVMQDLCGNQRDILFYSFSNGGCAISYMLTRSLLNSQSTLLKNIKGHIFDSCPVFPNKHGLQGVERAFVNIIGISVLNPVIKALTWVVVNAVLRFNQDVKEFLPRMTDSPLRTPQLFLFSKQDELAPYEDILTFMKDRQDRGVDVHHKLWETSPHVGHMKLRPEEYTKEIDKFVKLCLNK